MSEILAWYAVAAQICFLILLFSDCSFIEAFLLAPLWPIIYIKYAWLKLVRTP